DFKILDLVSHFHQNMMSSPQAQEKHQRILRAVNRASPKPCPRRPLITLMIKGAEPKESAPASKAFDPTKLETSKEAEKRSEDKPMEPKDDDNQSKKMGLDETD